jgi:hypothetical protein
VLTNLLALITLAPSASFEPGTRIVYAGSPRWDVSAPARLLAGRHDLELHVTGDTVHVDGLTLLRNTTREAASGTLWIEETRHDAHLLEGLPEGWRFRPDVTVDREPMTLLRRNVRLSDEDLAPPGSPERGRSALVYELKCPPRGEEHVVVKYSVPLGRSAFRPADRLCAYDFSSMAEAKVAPKVFVRLGSNLRLLAVRPDARITRSANGKMLEIDQIDLSREQILFLRFAP